MKLVLDIPPEDVAKIADTFAAVVALFDKIDALQVSVHRLEAEVRDMQARKS